jgi:hypothetical protein
MRMGARSSSRRFQQDEPALQVVAFEELEVMVLLTRHRSFEELLAIDIAIVASIEPDMMAKTARTGLGL